MMKEMSKIRRVEYQRRAMVDNEGAPNVKSQRARVNTVDAVSLPWLIQVTMPTLPFFLIWGGR